MKHFILFSLFILSFATSADVDAVFNYLKPEQTFSGVQPNDVSTSSFQPNVEIHATSDFDGLYVVLGFNLLCEGDQFTQVWSKGQGSPNKTFTIEAPTTTVNTYEYWPTGTKICNLTWTGEAAGTKTSTGASINFTFKGAGFDISISGSSTEEPPNNRKEESGSKLFQMIKDPAPSGSTGSSC